MSDHLILGIIGFVVWPLMILVAFAIPWFEGDDQHKEDQ